MARARVKNRAQIERSIKLKLRKALRDKDLRVGIGDIVVDGIKDNKLGTAKRSTQESRRYLEQYNNTDPKYKRTNINATFTGELLNDLLKNVKSRFTGKAVQFIIEHSNKLHKRYKTNPSSKRRGKKSPRNSYSDVSKHVQDKGYEYLQIKPGTSKKVVSFIKERLKKLLK